MSLTMTGATARWEALGTYVHLTVGDAAALPEAQLLAERILLDVDVTCSRFRPDSDLSRANAGAGTWVDVDPLLVAATTAALHAAEVTDGLVDPCLGRALISLGYDQTINSVRARDPREWVSEFERVRPQAWRSLAVDDEGRIFVPEGTNLDLGATAKAWASDVIASAILEIVEVPSLVSLGGDIRIAQVSPRDWPIRITERPGDEEGELINLDGGGLATSSTQARRWTTRGGEFHHLIDPRNGLPALGPWRTVSATGPTALAANIATTAALVLGDEAVPWFVDHDVTARLIANDGSVTHVGAWPTGEDT
jgi:thiamine biosynthesis lipoprotein